MIPDDLWYTAEHEWVRASDDGAVRIGITHYAQDALGDIVFVQLPEAGTTVDVGAPLGEVESTKSVSDIYAPVAGTVRIRNEAVLTRPELLNSDPYGEGWLVEIEAPNTALPGSLLDADAYRALTGAS